MANEKPQPTSKRKAVVEDTLLVSVLKRYFKYAGAALAVWGFGYYQFSPAWILLGLVVITWKEKHNKLQQKKIEISQQAARNEKEAILARVEDLPSWVRIYADTYKKYSCLIAQKCVSQSQLNTDAGVCNHHHLRCGMLLQI